MNAMLRLLVLLYFTVTSVAPQRTTTTVLNQHNHNNNSHNHALANTTIHKSQSILVQPVYELLNRVLHYNDSRRDFQLSLVVPTLNNNHNNENKHIGRASNNNRLRQASTNKIPAFFRLYSQWDIRKQQTVVCIQAGPTKSELTAGIGWYLRHIVHATSLDMWPPMNITNIDVSSSTWPVPISKPVYKRRNVPYSYLMNVCTHSYSLVWYNAEDWIRFMDWMALSGINMMLALTGQEWIQYKVFQRLGVSEEAIRNWFNGPAFLTWSRGQNEYGSGIAGPLPTSWMIQQWELQKFTILPRLRELDIVGQLPAFQGNVPIEVKQVFQDANITEEGATGWMDSLDPLFARVANLWMETLLQDFGTDHWYQLDGYFNGGTAPWMEHGSINTTGTNALQRRQQQKQHQHHDDLWYRRGVAAFEGLNATDPDAIWSFQGFAFVGWNSLEQASYLKGFVDAVPSKDRFVVMDMSYDPQEPEWQKWNSSAFFGASFVWNVLHNFGGTDGIKGDLQKVNQIPFDALQNPMANIIGLGATPEGITHNPAYYDYLYDQPFQTSPQQNIIDNLVSRAHQRYGLNPTKDFNDKIKAAWAFLGESLYQTDRSVQDTTGVGHWGSNRLKDSASLFQKDRYTPTPIMCKVFRAFEALLAASSLDKTILKSPAYKYDLVNLGREVMAQLSTPAALNFSDAIARDSIDMSELARTGGFYKKILLDLDSLVGTEESFLLGKWTHSARSWGKKKSRYSDCDLPSADFPQMSSNNHTTCEIFYEWNARCQVTTWNPTLRESKKVPGGPIDYAAKHWNGLIADYYAKRIDIALGIATNGKPLDSDLFDRALASHAFNWTYLQIHEGKGYPTSAIGDFVESSANIVAVYKTWFSSCHERESFQADQQEKRTS